MPLRILFADDSMTAQNMGKKILSEAGYEVIAVSNGAAAVKKIAEQKPDIIILDVYMPGYSGLEVCEKVRGSLDTAKTPVLLTVGKMEPYKPEDSNRVKADGVIIKPFEASDLLAIIKKFEERLALAPPPPMMQPVTQERTNEEPVITAAEAAAEQRSNRGGMQPMVDVPDHMAGSAAFGDLLGSEPSHEMSHFAVNTPASAFETSVIVPAPPMPVTDYELPVSMTQEHEPQAVVATEVQTGPEAAVEPASPESATAEAPEVEATGLETDEAEVAQAETALEPVPVDTAEANAIGAEPAPEPSHPHFIPVFKDPEPPSSGYEVMPTAAPPIPNLEIPREPALQETADEVTRNTVADHVEPGLMSTIGQQVEAFPTQPEEAAAAVPSADASPAAPANSPGEESYSVPLPAIDATSAVTNDDFEARVAAAMAAYNHRPEAAETPQEPVAAEAHTRAAAAEIHTNASNVHAAQAPTAEIQPAPVPSFEYQPAAGAAEAPAAQNSAHFSQAHESAVAASVEAALPEVAAALTNETGAEHHNIAQAVHRAMERLKPDLVEEIMRELKAKK
ncbi:MAG: response regulator [Candidatus Angelobacter sp.]